MKIVYSNVVTVTEPTREIRAYAAGLVLANPEYEKKKRMGKWLGQTPKEIRLAESLYVDGLETIIFPAGCIPDIYHITKSQGMRLFAAVPHLKWESDISLYPYQVDALEAATRARQGVVVMPCGSGKTQTALAIAHAFGMPVLWLTHTHDLLRQSMERAKAVFRLESGDIGTITQGKANCGRILTFATVQTMAAMNLQEYADAWGVIIVDECHKAIGAPTRVMLFYKVLRALRARHRFGLTATPERADGLEAAMYALLGPKVIEVPREAVAASTVPVVVSICHNDFVPENVLMPDGTINYSRVIAATADDEARNTRISALATRLARENRPTLILTDRVEHAVILRDGLESVGIDAAMLTGRVSKKVRAALLDGMRDGDIMVIVATYALAKEGLDIRNLDSVIFATPKKDYATVIQAAGRVSRASDGKKRGVVYDFVDSWGFFRRIARERVKHYKREGFDVFDPGFDPDAGYIDNDIF